MKMNQLYPRHDIRVSLSPPFPTLPFLVPGLGGRRNGSPREVIEAALAYVVQKKVEAAYARSDLFERRRRFMGDWAAHLAG